MIIGMRDDGVAVGIPHARKLLEELPNKIKDLLGIVAQIDLRTDDGKDLIEIRVQPYPNPISYKGKYHIRSGSTKQELRGAALDQFLLRKYGRTWDGVPVPTLADSDLDPVAFRLFRAKAAQSGRMDGESLVGSDSVLVDRLKLREGNRLTRAALLLFHPDPSRHFFGASIKIGYFANEADLLYQDEIEGSLIEQVEKAMDLLTTKYMKAGIRYAGLQRIETLPFAKEAVREALLNAVVHKDYSSGIPIQIKVFEHKIVFWNSAVASSELTVEKLLGPHASHPHNPLVAGGFFRAGMIESWGRGIEKIHMACKVHGTAAPLIRPESNGVWVELYGLPTTEMTPENKNATEKSTIHQKTPEAILHHLQETPQPSLAEIARRMGKNESTVKRAVKRLQQQEKLERIGPDKGGFWVVKQ